MISGQAMQGVARLYFVYNLMNIYFRLTWLLLLDVDVWPSLQDLYRHTNFDERFEAIQSLGPWKDGT